MYGFKQFIDGNPIDAEVISLYLNQPKLTVNEIASFTKRPVSEIYRILHAHDVSPNRLKSNHDKVKSLLGLGWNTNEIAKLTGYTERNIRYILKKLEG